MSKSESQDNKAKAKTKPEEYESSNNTRLKPILNQWYSATKIQIRQTANGVEIKDNNGYYYLIANSTDGCHGKDNSSSVQFRVIHNNTLSEEGLTIPDK